MTALDHMMIARSQMEMADESNSITRKTLSEEASAHLHTAYVHLQAAIEISEPKPHESKRIEAMAPMA